MDFQSVFQEGVISQSTLDWLEPLRKKEQQDTLEIQEGAAEARLFAPTHDDEDSETDRDDDLVESGAITMYGITFGYLRDAHSVGHGNRVWHASIATCMYIRRLLLSSPPTSTEEVQTQMPFQALELGAGTAIPSLFLAHLLSTSPEHHVRKPIVHITDGKQYRNIRQILLSLKQQPDHVQDRVNFRISPHNWGEGIGVVRKNANVVSDNNDDDSSLDTSFLDEECRSFFDKNHDEQESPSSPQRMNTYDLIVVSDCIYNPNFHDTLLDSVSAMLKLPTTSNNVGGKAIISFSLHGNTNEENVWDFLNKISAKRHPTKGGQWKLQVGSIDQLIVGPDDEAIDDGQECTSLPRLEQVNGHSGWHMEETMKDLNLWAANVEPKRWIAYVYEVTWARQISFESVES